MPRSLPSLTRLLAPALAGLGLVAAGGCADPFTDVAFDNWEPEVALPLLATTFTIEDALRGAEFAERLDGDSSGVLALTLQSELFDAAPGEVLDFERIVLPLRDTAGAYTPEELDVPYGVTRIDLNAGLAIASFANDFPVDLDVTVRLPGVTADGAPYERSFVVPALSTVDDTLRVRRATLATDEDGRFRLGYTATTPEGQRVVVTLGVVQFVTDGYSYAEGSFADLEVDLSRDSIALAFLDAFEPGSVALDDPSITIAVENETGVPLRVRAPEAYVVGRQGQRVNLRSDLDGGVVIAPAAAGEAFASTVVKLDRDNSNLAEAVNRFPGAVVLALSGGAEAPAGEPGRFAVRRADRIRGTLTFEAPLNARFRGFEMRERFDFDASPLADARVATFFLGVASDFGLAVDAQVYFHDAAGQTFDSLFARPTRVALAEDNAEPLPNQRYDAKGRPVHEVEIPLSNRQVETLADARGASVLVRVTSPRGGLGATTLHSDDEMSVRLGARVGVDPELPQ